MRGGPVFAQVLDDKLRELPDAGPTAASSYPNHHRPRALNAARFADPFLFAAPYARFRASSVVAAQRPADVRRARALTPSEQSALACLNQLGACLASDYSPRELRRAFRLLALQYHPDRHPSSDAARHARLSQMFSSITDHHRRLAAALERNPLVVGEHGSLQAKRSG